MTPSLLEAQRVSHGIHHHVAKILAEQNEPMKHSISPEFLLVLCSCGLAVAHWVFRHVWREAENSVFDSSRL